jgi:hypothetical protein
VALKLMWDAVVFPLTVLYSPNLRLRYRCTWGIGAAQVNQACERMIFKNGIEGSKGLATAIEVKLQPPPNGCVYVKDDSSDSLDGSTIFFYNKGIVQAAIVSLPENETTPYLTLGITLHEIGHCLGLFHSDDPGSVMYFNAQVRSQLLSNLDIDTIFKKYETC